MHPDRKIMISLTIGYYPILRGEPSYGELGASMPILSVERLKKTSGLRV